MCSFVSPIYFFYRLYLKKIQVDESNALYVKQIHVRWCGCCSTIIMGSFRVCVQHHEQFHGKQHITSDNMEMARSTGGTSCKSYTVSVSTFCCTYNVSCNLQFYACLNTRLENNCGNVYINHRHSNSGPR